MLFYMQLIIKNPFLIYFFTIFLKKLMKYHKDLKDGRVPGDVEFDDEQDVTDLQLAASS